MPQNHIRPFQFFKSRSFTTAYRLQLFFPKPALRASKPHTAVSIFQEPALRISIPPTAVSLFPTRQHFAPQYRLGQSQFFKSQRFALQNRLRKFQFFQSRRFVSQSMLFFIAPQYREKISVQFVFSLKRKVSSTGGNPGTFPCLITPP